MDEFMEYELYTGRYTGEPSEDGVCSWNFDGAVLRRKKQFGKLINPSYVLPHGDRLYVVEEILDGASVACFSVDNKEESSVLWHKEVPGAGLCHCAIIGNSLYVSGYTGGTLTGVNAISGQVMFYKEFSGHGSNTLRQEKSHIHSAQPTPDGSRLLVADLGTDRLYKFVMDAKIGLMLDEEQPYFQVRAGQGPRHFAFHPNGKWLYLVR